MAFPNPSSEADHLETNLAYYLQNSEPGDPQALSLLIEYYADDLVRLAISLVDSNWKMRLHHGRVFSLVVSTLVTAQREKNRFWGETSVRDWLYSLLVANYRRDLKDEIDPESQLGASLPNLGDNPARDGDEAKLWSGIDSLKEKQRLPLVLRCFKGLSVLQIARILSARPDSVSKNLDQARQMLAPELFASNGDRVSSGESHFEYLRLIQAEHDGVLDVRSENFTNLREHLHTCQACREFSEAYNAWHASCSASLNYRWPQSNLSRHSCELLAQEVQFLFQTRQSDLKFSLPIRQLGYLVLVVGLVAILFWSANRYLPEEPASVTLPTLPPVPTHVSLPTPIGETPSRPIAQDRGRTGPDIRVDLNLQPSISGNGRWIAFTSVEFYSYQDEPENYPGVFLYNRENDLRERVSLTSDGEIPDGISFSPSISDDGQRIVFVSDAENLSTIPRGCETTESFGCMDIYLRDRSAGTTQRISLTTSGEAPASPSYSPLLSGDGRKAFFWSHATNLVEGETPVCDDLPSGAHCSNFFIFDTVTNTLERLPIGRVVTDTFMHQEYSVSADGRFVAMTVEATDRIAEQLDLANERDVYLVDLEEGNFEPVNLSSSGTPGDGFSHQPAISADGRFVTFASVARNLVTGDTNEGKDIFVRNLDTGVTELVSVDPSGELTSQGIGEQSAGMVALASQKIGISEDGRFIVFTAQSSRLAGAAAEVCSENAEEMCSFLFVHDRLTGNTEQINPHENRRMQIDLLPDISSNGRWITFMELLLDCPEFETCFDVGFFDRELNTIRNLSRRFITPGSQQSESNSPPRIGEATVWTNSRRLFANFIRVNNVVFSGNGEFIATGSQDGTIQVWKSSDLSLFYSERGHNSSITDLAFSPDSEFLATASLDGSLKIWDFEENRLVYNLLGETNQLYSLAFSPDGRWLAGGTSQGLVMWEFRDNTLVQRYRLERPGRIRSLAFSPNSRLLALAADDNSVWVLNVQPLELAFRLGGQELDPLALAFSPDGNNLAVGTMDGSMNLWEFNQSLDGELNPMFFRTLWHPEWVNNLAFSPDGGILATLSNDFNIRLWSLPDGELIAQERSENSERALGLAFSPNGSALAVSTNQGSVMLYRDNLTVANPRFFSRLITDKLTIPPGYYPNYFPVPVELIQQEDRPGSISSWSTEFNQSIYTAMDTLGLEIQAPVILPPGMRFIGAKSNVEPFFGLSIFFYEYAPEGIPQGAMFLIQGPSPDIFPNVSVGTTARVERTRIFNQMGEYVEGDWLEFQSDDDPIFDIPSSWQWDPELPVRRLNWQQGNLGFSLTYVEYQDKPPQVVDNLSQAELLEIANNFDLVSNVNNTAQTLYTYHVQEGDNCTAIADRFGTQLGSLVSLNGLSGNCDLIFPGQEIQVPLPVARESWSTLDLDCDGSEERILINPYPIDFGAGSIFGFSVQTLASTGLYQDRWSFTIENVGAEYFGNPSVFAIDSCQRGLQLEVFNPSSGGSYPLAFRWDGEKMVQIQPRR